MLEYILYALAFIAVVLGIEGLWRLVRMHLGEELAVRRRLARARGSRVIPTRGRGVDPLSRILNARLPRLEQALARARAPVSSGGLLLGAVLLAAACFAGLAMLGAPRLLAAIAAGLVGAGLPYVVVKSMAARRRRRFLDQLPAAIDLMARSLQAGHPVATAMTTMAERMPAPLGPEFQLVVDEMTYGLDRDAALDNLVERFPSPELRMLTASLEVTRESGGNLAEVCLKLAAALRAKSRFRQKVVAISSEGRLTFWVVTALPVLVGGLLFALRRNFYVEVAADPLFWPMMAFAPLTLTLGAIVIWRMVNIRL
jgi:tight adherence protein B